MGGEFKKITVGYTTYDNEQMPKKADGTDNYPDDVAEMMRMTVKLAVLEWYNSVGHQFLTCEPEV